MPALAAQRRMLASAARSIPKSLLRQLFRRNITGSGRPGAAILILRLVRPPGITPSGVGGAVSASGHWRQSAKAAAASNALGTGYPSADRRSEEHTSELQSRPHLVCRLLLEKKKRNRR